MTRRRLADEVRDRLALAIREGELPPGTRLVEAQLARRLGISRSPVREALRLLERSGLVLAQEGLYFVPELGLQDLRELVQLRVALERLAVSLIVQRRPLPDLSALDEVVERMRATVVGDPSATAELSQLDSQFHRILCELPGHARLARMRLDMSDEIELAIAATNLRFASGEGFPEAHETVLAAIRTGRRSRAEHAIESHILSGLQRYEATSKGNGAAPVDPASAASQAGMSKVSRRAKRS